MEYLTRRNAFFFFFVVLALFMAYAPIKSLYDSSSQREYYSHIVLIPLVSIYLIYQNRKAIFADDQGRADSPRHNLRAGIPLLVIGALAYFLGQDREIHLGQNDFASVIALSAVLVLNGGFIYCYGSEAFKAALFPLLFLIFVIPIPSMLMDGIIHFLQAGSTEFTNILFMASGVPFFREGFVFHLPDISIEVAKQCSGIRSSLALFITALLAGHLFLRTWPRKVTLLFSIFPIAMFKNGVRIVTLTLLGNYVDPRILTSELHREGGIPFFVLALLLLVPVLYFLRRSEKTGFRPGACPGLRSGVHRDDAPE